MELQINKDYKITTDKLNFILNKRYKKEDGSVGFKIIGYFGTINNAMKSIVNNVTLQSDATEFQTLCDQVDAIKKDIDAIDFKRDWIESNKEDK